MADGTVLVRQAADGDRPIDNEVVNVAGTDVYRQRVQVPDPIRTRDTSLTPKGYQQLIPATSTALTVPGGAVYALLQARTNDISYRDDGVAPTIAAGMRIVVDTTLFYTGDLAALRFIGVAATLDVAFYGIG